MPQLRNSCNFLHLMRTTQRSNGCFKGLPNPQVPVALDIAPQHRLLQLLLRRMRARRQCHHIALHHWDLPAFCCLNFHRIRTTRQLYGFEPQAETSFESHASMAHVRVDFLFVRFMLGRDRLGVVKSSAQWTCEIKVCQRNIVNSKHDMRQHAAECQLASRHTS